MANNRPFVRTILLVLAALLTCGSLRANHVQSKGCVTLTSPADCTFTVDTTAGRLIIVAIKFFDVGAAVVSITDTGLNSYTPAVSAGPNWGLSQYVYYAKNIAGGANTVSVAYTGSWAAVVAIHEYNSLDSTSPLDKTSSATGGSGAGDSGAQTISQGDELIFGVEISLQSLAGKAGSGFEPRVSSDYGGGFLTEDKIVSSVASYSTTFQDNGSGWLATMATFKIAAGGPARRVTVIRR